MISLRKSSMRENKEISKNREGEGKVKRGGRALLADANFNDMIFPFRPGRVLEIWHMIRSQRFLGQSWPADKGDQMNRKD